MATIRGGNVPHLVVSQRVIEKMTAAAHRFIADETGEAMVGLVVPDTRTNGVPTIYVLDTISPDGGEDAPVRQWGMFEQGDDLQGDIFNWLTENWQAYRLKRRTSFGNALQAKWDVPLLHVGDWHKQPGYMIKPSFGDLMTALNMLDDKELELDFLLAPIVTLGHPSTTKSEGIAVNYLTIPMDDDSDMRIDFWYIDRQVRMFQPIIPVVQPENQLPGLTQYPWHLVDDDRFNTEVNQLSGDGLFTSVLIWDADDKPPLEVCFLTARRGMNKMLVIITPWNYPLAAPSARVAPFVSMDDDEDIYDVFEQIWKQSAPVKNPPGWHWSEKSYLIDYIHELEKSLDLPLTNPAVKIWPAPAADEPLATGNKPESADKKAEAAASDEKDEADIPEEKAL